MRSNKKVNYTEYFFEIPNYVAVFLFPFFLMMTSPVLLEMSKSFGTDVRNLNLIFTFLNIGVISGQLTSVFYNVRFKRINIISLSYIISIIVVILLFFSNSLIFLFILYIIYGYIMGVIFIQANENLLYSSIENKARLLTLAHTFWPIGALLGPVWSSYIVQKNLPWNYMYFAIIFFIILNVILYNILTRKRKYELTDSSKSNFSLRKTFQNKQSNIIFILTACALLFYAMSETVISSWLPTFLRLEKMFDVQIAGYAISIFWAAIIIGRLVTSILVGKINSNYLIIFLIIIGLVSVFFIIFSNDKNIILTAIIFSGLGYSGIFPLLISKGSNVYSINKGLLLTILMATGALGISSAPFLTRVLAEYNMILSVMLTVFFIVVSMIFIISSIFSEKIFKEKR